MTGRRSLLGRLAAVSALLNRMVAWRVGGAAPRPVIEAWSQRTVHNNPTAVRIWCASPSRGSPPRRREPV